MRIAIDELARVYFQDAHLDASILSGGYSAASNYLIKVGGKKYVLRIQEPEGDYSNEIYVMSQAAKRKIAPKINYISPDQRAILMEFVEGATLSRDQAFDSKSFEKIARQIEMIHTIPKNLSYSFSFADAVKKAYDKLQKKNQFVAESQEMMQEFRTIHHRFSQMEGPKATIHGDLNPKKHFYRR